MADTKALALSAGSIPVLDGDEVIGIITDPLAVADVPITPWMNSGMNSGARKK